MTRPTNCMRPVHPGEIMREDFLVSFSSRFKPDIFAPGTKFVQKRQLTSFVSTLAVYIL